VTFADHRAVLDDPAWWAFVEVLRKLVAVGWLRERERHTWADLTPRRGHLDVRQPPGEDGRGKNRRPRRR
jgi:hypothetical protein